MILAVSFGGLFLFYLNPFQNLKFNQNIEASEIRLVPNIGISGRVVPPEPLSDVLIISSFDNASISILGVSYLIFIFKFSLKQRIYYKGEKARNYLSVDKSRFRVRFVYHYLLHMVTQSATIAVPPRLKRNLRVLLSTEGRRDYMASFSFSLLFYIIG